MAKNYQVGLIITGNAKGGISAVKATKDELEKLNTKQRGFQKETKNSRTSISSMAKDFGLLKGVIAGVSISTAAMGVVMRTKAITEMKVMAETLNVSIKTLSEWTTAGEKFNIQGDKMGDIFKDIQDKVGDFAATGGGEAKDIFEKLNLDINEFVGLSADQQLLKIGAAIDEVGSHSEKIFFLEALANDASRLLPILENNAAGLKEAQNEARLLGTSISAIDAESVAAAGREFQRTQDIVSGFGNELTIALAPAFDGMNDAVIDAIKSMGGWNNVLPEAVSLLSSLSKILAVGGGLYLGMQAMPYLMTASAAASKVLSVNVLATSLAYSTGVGPVSLFTSSLAASTAATWSAVTAFGVLKTAALGMFSAYAGWEIGSYLREQFVEVRVAGLAFVGAMETGLVNLSYSFSAIAPKAKQIWGELTTWLQNQLGSLYGLIGDGLAKIGADEMAAGYQDFAESLSGTSDIAKQATEELANLENQRKSDIETVDRIIVSLINHEYAQTASTDAIIKDTEAKTNNVNTVAKELTANQQLIVSLGQQLSMLGLTEEQKILNTNLSKLSADATEQEIAAVKALSAEQYKASKGKSAPEGPSELSKEYDELIKQVDDYSGAWASAGNVIVDTFGTIGQQMDKLFVSQEKYATALKFNQEQQEKSGADLQKLKAEEISLTYASTQAELNSYASIAGAAADMFGEKTAAAKAFHAIEQAMAVASLAMSVQKMVMGTTETGVHVANEATKQSANGLTAITSAFAAPFPVNFVAGAAMIGIISSLIGGSFSSSGTAPVSAEVRQETQGTGTVLGSDDKSASITNSLDRQEELQLDQYAELREMNTSLSDLNSNITSLAASLVRSFGKFDAASYSGELGEKSTTSKIESALLGGSLTSLDPTGVLGKIIGGFSSTKKTLIDSGISIVSQTMGEIIDSGVVDAQQYFDIKTRKEKGWGLSSKTTYNTEYEDVDDDIARELGLVFTDIGKTINSAVDVLGVDLTENLRDFDIEIPNLSLKDLSGDEIQAELEAFFSSQADDMATYLMPNLAVFQTVGTTLYETLIRLAQEQAVFNSVLEITGNTLSSIDANQAIQATQAIIDFAGGIENLQSAASDFFNGFYSESEQFEYNQKQLIAQFAALDQELPATADGFKKLVQGLDPLNKEEQKLYAQLLLLSGQTAEYYETLEDLKAAQSEAISSLKTDISTLLDDLLGPTNDIQTLIDAEESRWQDQQDAAEKLYETEMSRYESALDAEKTLDEYINGLAFSENSTLSEQDQFRLARDNFASSTNQAANGDYSAVADATSDASQYLEIGKELFGTSSNMYKSMFADVNKTLTDLQSVYADFEAPEEQVIEESAELISLREQLAAQEAAAQQAENQALADLLAEQLTDLSELSGDSIDALIESFSIDLSELGELLSVNLTELIDVTKNGTLNSEAITNASNVIDSSNNVIAFPEINTPIAVNQAATIATSESQASTASNTEMLAELKLLREEVAALRADANDNAADAAAQRESQISTAETQTAEIVRGNLRQVAVS
jgi:phosphopantetheine adenylyltransferase